MKPFCTPVTRTPETEALYLNRAEDLIARARREIGNESANIVEIACWLHDLAPVLTKATFRQYRAALCYWVENQEDICAADKKQAILILRENPPVATRRGKGRTSSGKAKSIKPEDLDRLLDALHKSRRQFASALIGWMHATLLTGLRPVEWVELKHFYQDGDGRWFLSVKNAKATNGRGNGVYRHLRLSLTDRDVAIIKTHHSLLSLFAANGAFKYYYEQCKLLLSTTAKKVFGAGRRKRQVTLYTFRHQFTANLKSSGKTKREVADAMGHVSERTAVVHYGKRRRGWGGDPGAASGARFGAGGIAYPSKQPGGAHIMVECFAGNISFSWRPSGAG